MATCDVWKQTHKNFQNILPTTATTTKMLTQQEVYTWYESFCKVDQSEDHLFTNGKSGSISDCLVLSSDVSDSSDDTVNSVCGSDQLNIDLVANWGECKDESGFDDTVFDICDEEKNDDYEFFKHTYYNCIPVWQIEQQQQQSQQDGYQPLEKKRIMVENDPCTINDDDDVYCVPITHDADGAHSISNINVDYCAHSVSLVEESLNDDDLYDTSIIQSEINSDADGIHNVSLELGQQKHKLIDIFTVGGEYDTPVDNEPICNSSHTAQLDVHINQHDNNNNIQSSDLSNSDLYGVSIPQTKINFDNISVHGEQQYQQDEEILLRTQGGDGVFSNMDSASSGCETNHPCTISQQQFDNENHSAQYQHQKQSSPSKPNNLDVVDGIFSSTIHKNNEITLPCGFYPLKEFIDTIIQFEKRFGDDIGASKSSLNKLKLVFTDENNANYVYCPLVIHDDFDPGDEFVPLKRLLYVFEDLDIEYGDTIGVSSYGDVNMHLLEKIDNTAQNNYDLKSPNVNISLDSSLFDIKNNSELHSLKVTHNMNIDSQFLPHYKKKRGKKKKRYKWIVKNNLANPTLKTFDKNHIVEKDISNISTTNVNRSSNGNVCFKYIHNSISNGSDCGNVSPTSISTNNGRYDASNDILNDNNIFCTVTARAPPYDPDMIK